MNMMQSTSPAQAELLRQLSPSERDRYLTALERRLAAFAQPNGQVHIPGEAILGVGVRKSSDAKVPRLNAGPGKHPVTRSGATKHLVTARCLERGGPPITIANVLGKSSPNTERVPLV